MLTYNFERFVGDAIESVLAQDWPAERLQVVVVDNGSTDGSREILARYARDVDLRLIENVSVNEAINVYLEAAEGDYIAFASGDDMWPRDKVSYQVGFLEEQRDIGLLYGDMELINGEGETISDSFMRTSGLQPRSGLLLGSLMQQNVVSGGSAMLRGSLLPAFHPLPPQAHWEDWWIATCVARVAPIAFTPHITYRYRRHGNNLALGATGDRLEHATLGDIRFRRWLVETVAPGEVTLLELAGAVAQVRTVIAQAAARSGRAPAELAPVSGGDLERARRAADRAAADPDLERAAFSLAAAFAADPHDPELVEALARALDAAHASGSSREAVAADPAALLADTRGRVVVALADEVVADPALLSRYAAVVKPDDDATLVLFAPGWDGARAAAELGAALDRAGIADDAAPDMLALPLEDSLGVRCALAVGADALLTAREPEWPLAGLPRFEPARPALAA